jgi:hypothetical protein
MLTMIIGKNDNSVNRGEIQINRNLACQAIQKCMLIEFTGGPVRETHVLLRRPRFLKEAAIAAYPNPSTTFSEHTFLHLLHVKLRFAFFGGESVFIQPLIASASPINLHLLLNEQMPWGGEGVAGELGA